MTNRMRSTKGKKNVRRSHHALSVPEVQEGSDGISLRHMASIDTGKYKGREILKMEKKASKAQPKEAEKVTKEVAKSPELDLSTERKK